MHLDPYYDKFDLSSICKLNPCQDYYCTLFACISYFFIWWPITFIPAFALLCFSQLNQNAFQFCIMISKAISHHCTDMIQSSLDFIPSNE